MYHQHNCSRLSNWFPLWCLMFFLLFRRYNTWFVVFCSDLRTTGCKDNLHPDCFLETRFLQQVACFTGTVPLCWPGSLSPQLWRHSAIMNQIALRHQMEAFSALLALCAGNSPVTDEFPPQRPVARSFNVFFDLRLNKWLSKQWWGLWFETPLRPLWRH